MRIPSTEMGLDDIPVTGRETFCEHDPRYPEDVRVARNVPVVGLEVELVELEDSYASPSAEKELGVPVVDGMDVVVQPIDELVNDRSEVLVEVGFSIHDWYPGQT